MAKLEEFLNLNMDLVVSDDELSNAAEGMTLDVLLKRMSPERLEVVYQGDVFTIASADVQDISDRPHASSPGEGGKAVQVKLKPDAVVRKQVPAVVAPQPGQPPFAFEFTGPPAMVVPSLADEAWRRRVGYPLDPVGNAMLGASFTFTGWLKLDDFHGDRPTGAEMSLAPRREAVTASGSQSTCYWETDFGRGWIYDETRIDD